VERSPADDDPGTRGSSDVALADLPSESGAHWAHRDEILHRPASAAPAPFRRPPAVNSFPDADGPTGSQEADSWDAFAPSDNSAGKEAAWETFGESPKVDDASGPRQLLVPAAPPSSRASFGVTDEPIGGPRNAPVSPAAPASRRFRGAPPPPAAPPAPVAAPSSFGGPGSPASFFDSPTGAPTGSPSPASSFAAPSFDDPPAASFDAPPAVSSDGPPVLHTSTGDIPSIGEFLGEGREIRPHRAGRRDHPGADPVRGAPAAPRRSRAVTLATVALSTVVLLVGAVAGMVFFAGADGDLTSVLRLGAGDGDGDDSVATAPLAGRTAASFEMAAATTKVTVRTQDLGEDLFRITAADESGTVPQPVVNEEGRVELQLSSDGERTSGTVEVLLNAKVTWALRFVGATDEQILDLTGGRVSAVDLAGGSRRVDLTLAKATGTVPIRITGAIDDLSVTSPAGNPVRVQVGGGAKTVTAGKRTLRDVSPGSTLTPKDWAVPDRYDVDAAARLTLLSVRTS
jgi:hypothetical protein